MSEKTKHILKKIGENFILWSTLSAAFLLFLSLGMKLQNQLPLITLITVLIASILTYFIANFLQKTRDNFTDLNNRLDNANNSAEQANQAKFIFFSNMTHELRTHLNAIIGYSEILLEELKEKKMNEFLPDLKKINLAGTQLLSLINNLFDISKIEAGKMEFSPSNFNINQFLSEIEPLAHLLAEKKHNQFVLQYSPFLGSMYTDENKLHQSLRNLIENACKFTENGMISLNADYFEKNQKLWIKFEVSDSGVGISPDNLAKLSKSLSQDSSQYSVGARGLSLFIALQFSRLMGGDISISSTEGKGSTFTMFLPVIYEDIKHADQTKREIKISGKSASVGRGTLVVISDNPSFHQFMDEYLGKTYRLIHTYNGKDGLEMINFYHPDAVTLDMPKTETDGMIKAIKSDETLSNIPVIVTSEKEESEYLSLGVNDFLTKPMQPSVLLAALKKYTSEKSPLVLVVDDDPVARDYMTRILFSAGCKVIEAKNGKEAMELVEKAEPSLILLDLIMPEMDGFEVVSRLQANDNWSKIPVIIVSGKSLTAEDYQRLGGGVEYIFKKGAFGQKEFSTVIKHQIETAINKSKFYTTFQKALGDLEEKFSVTTENKDRKKLILIIDATKGVYNALEFMIKEANLNIIQAFNGEEGLKLAQKNHPDLILLDVLLPGIDGWQVLARLKEDDELRSIPVIMLTQRTSENFGYSRGVADFLVKPVTGHVLVNHIKKNIDLKEMNYILVVDDDDSIRKLLVSSLQKVGWRVEEAASGQETIEMIEREIPSLILLDILMPGMNGFEVIEKLQQNPKWIQIPVIVLTAAQLTEEELKLLNQATLRVFQKSDYRLNDLLKEIGRVIQS